MLFRSLSMWLRLPVLWAVTAVLKGALRIERKDWREVSVLTVTNMLVWHVLAIIAVQASRAQRLAAADLVICNEGLSLEQLRDKVVQAARRFGL